MTCGHTNSQGSPASGVTSDKQPDDMDDFGDFSQGPSFPGQGGINSDFSDFQGASQIAAQPGGSLFTGILKFVFGLKIQRQLNFILLRFFFFVAQHF